MTRHLQKRPPGHISPAVILSRLFAFFLVLSLMAGPLAMDRAMAAVPAASHAAMSDDAHCAPATDASDDEAVPDPCCAAMCSASALPTQARSGAASFSRLPAVSAAASFHRGVLSEISTPPPRGA
jgi:hypothetical protein